MECTPDVYLPAALRIRVEIYRIRILPSREKETSNPTLEKIEADFTFFVL